MPSHTLLQGDALEVLRTGASAPWFLWGLLKKSGGAGQITFPSNGY